MRENKTSLEVKVKVFVEAKHEPIISPLTFNTSQDHEQDYVRHIVHALNNQTHFVG